MRALYVLVCTSIDYISLVETKKTSEEQLFIPSHCIPAISTRGERGDGTESIDMEQFEDESLSNSDYELHENTPRPKKMKRQEWIKQQFYSDSVYYFR